MIRKVFLASLAALMPFFMYSCKAEADIDAVFSTTVSLYKAHPHEADVYETRVKFTLIDKIRPSLEKFGIDPSDLDIKSFKLVNLNALDAAVLDAPIDALVFIELVREEADVTSESRTLLCSNYGTTLRHLTDQSMSGSSQGTSLLKQVIGDDSNTPSLKHVLLTYQIIFENAPRALTKERLKMDFDVEVSMSKTFEDVL